MERLVNPHRGDLDQGAVAGLGLGAPGWVTLGGADDSARYVRGDGPVLLEPGAAGVEPFDVGDAEAGAEAAIRCDRGVFELDSETERLGAAFGDRREGGALGFRKWRAFGGLGDFGEAIGPALGAPYGGGCVDSRPRANTAPLPSTTQIWVSFGDSSKRIYCFMVTLLLGLWRLLKHKPRIIEPECDQPRLRQCQRIGRIASPKFPYRVAIIYMRGLIYVRPQSIRGR